MIARVEWAPSLVREIPNGHWYAPPHSEPRVGVCLHYDASGSDAGALAWFADPKCGVSYNYLVLDDGSYVIVAPLDCGAWHAGVCRPSDPRLAYRSANRALYGIAATSSGTEDVKPFQLLTIAFLTRKLFEREGWPTTDTWRVTGHRAEAWPRGRKSDPEGADLKNPIFSPDDVRQLLPRMVP